MAAAKTDKLYAKVKNNPRQVTFFEMKKLLEDYGFTVENNSGGSHYSVTHPEIPHSIKPLPYQKPQLKPYLVKQLMQMIDYVKGC